jgi:phosphohistidine phosphatase SixA
MIVFLLRHADRDGSEDALSPAGMERAGRLASMLAESGVTKAFCSDAKRTRQTLAPLEQKLGNGLAVQEVAVSGGIGAHVAAVVAAIRALPAAAVAVVIGHSNTIGDIIGDLGGGDIDPIGEDEFDKLFVLFGAQGGGRMLLKLRY